MSSTTRSTLSAILGKAKVGGLVLAAMVLVAGTAEASTGVVFSRGDDSVASVDDEPVGDSGDDGTVVDDSGDDGTVVDDSDEDGTVEDGTVEDGTVEDGTVEDDNCDPTTEAKNHGAYVSEIAHSTPPGPGHGAAVAAAAHSDCGKPGSDDATVDQRAGKDKRSSKGKDKVKAIPPGQAKKDDPSYSPGNSDHSGVSHGNSAGHSKAGGNGKGKDK